MNNLSITQKYFICSLNEKGKISQVSSEKLVCFVAGALLELKLENCISIEGKNVTVIRELPCDLNYLKPLYNFINQKGTISLKRLFSTYNYLLTDKRLNELIESVGDCLALNGVVEVKEKGMFSSVKKYIPKKQIINMIIAEFRGGILEDGEITDEIITLITLLDKSKILKTYFSKYELKEIKDKIAKITNTPDGKIVKEMIQYIEIIFDMIFLLMS